MSILINGMDMPKGSSNLVKTSYPCDLVISKYGKHELVESEARYSCYEIPTPHGRLIDADRLIAVLKSTTSISQSDYDLFNHVIGLIEHQPVIIEKEK